MWVALALLIVSSSLVAGMLLKDVRAISVMALVSAGGRRVVELLMVSNRAPGFLKLERDALPYWTWILAAELGVWFVVGWLGHQARVAIAARMAR